MEEVKNIDYTPEQVQEDEVKEVVDILKPLAPEQKKMVIGALKLAALLASQSA